MTEEKPHILFSLYGDKWYRTEYPLQCQETLTFGGRCQGVKGHEGFHWHYQPDGSLERTHDDGGESTTPPDHKKYIHPKKMQPLLHRSNHVTAEVTDSAEIERLNKNQMGENESITRPVPPDVAHKIMKEVGYDPDAEKSD